MARLAGKDYIRIRFDTDFDEEDLTDELDAMKKRTKDFRVVFTKIREDLQELWDNNFLANGLPSGGWAPLSPKYGAWKSAHFPGEPPMIRTGKLFSSLVTLRGAPNDIGRTRATFGTNIKYAKFHQYGTTKMPKREIVFAPDVMRKKWADYARDWVKDGDLL